VQHSSNLVLLSPRVVTDSLMAVFKVTSFHTPCQVSLLLTLAPTAECPDTVDGYKVLTLPLTVKALHLFAPVTEWYMLAINKLFEYAETVDSAAEVNE